jgi:hypothetical protein
MKPSTGRRSWVKLWVNDWLEGTTRYQMTDAQRAFWIDLLAMAGRSRFGGVVCSGKDGDAYIGYPLSKFQGLLAEPLDILATFDLFERTGKITLHANGEELRRLFVIYITNWTRYQSEYERTKRYRNSGATPNATESLLKKYGKGHTTEEEGNVETEKERPESPCSPPTENLSFESLDSSQSRATDREANSASIQAASLLRQGILANNPRAKVNEKQLIAWAHEVDLMIRIDKRTHEEIFFLVRWSQQDTFWKSNILSMKKLRDHFDQLTVKSRAMTEQQEPPWKKREREEAKKQFEAVGTIFDRTRKAKA